MEKSGWKVNATIQSTQRTIEAVDNVLYKLPPWSIPEATNDPNVDRIAPKQVTIINAVTTLARSIISHLWLTIDVNSLNRFERYTSSIVEHELAKRLYVQREKITEKKMNSMSRAPRWAYLAGGILIVIACLLGATIFYVGYETLFHGMDPRTPLLFIILPLSVLALLIMLTMAILLTRKRD